MKGLFALLEALPELIKLIKRLQENAKHAKKENKLKDDVKVINQAFKERDAEKLNALFNS